MITRLKKIFFVFLVLLLIAPIVYYLFFTFFILNPKLKETFKSPSEDLKSKIVTDLHTLKKHFNFKSITYKHNAHQYLTKHIVFSKGTEQKIKNKANENDLNQLFDKYTGNPTLNKIKKIANDPLINKIDTEWMRELNNFDHWNIYIDPYFIERMKNLSSMDSLDILDMLSTHPIANVKTFFNFSVVRFLKQIKLDKDSAYRNYSHALKIILSEGSLISHMFVSIALEYGYYFKKIYPINGYNYFNLKTSLAFKRVSWAWPGLMQQTFNKNIDDQFKEFLTPKYGVCAASSELPPSSLFSELVQHSYWPLEQNFNENLKRVSHFRKILLKKCNKDLLLTIENNRSSYLSSEKAFSFQNLSKESLNKGSMGFDVNVSSVPYLRRMIWITLVTTATPNYFTLYTEDRYKKDNEMAKDPDL